MGVPLGRLNRHRLDALATATNRGRRPGEGADRMVVEIFNAGEMPDFVPAYYMGRPAILTGDGCEGCTGAVTAAGEPFPVLVLGPEVPAIGDYLIATQAGGRWVAEKGKGTEETCLWWSTGDAPEELHWTDPFLGSFTLTRQEPGVDDRCWWSWCGEITTAASGPCPSRTIWFSVRVMGEPWNVTYVWQVVGTSTVGCSFLFPTANCPDVGTEESICPRSPTAWPLGFVDAVFWGINPSIPRPYAQTWEFYFDTLDDLAALFGLYDCVDHTTVGPNTWSLTE